MRRIYVSLFNTAGAGRLLEGIAAYGHTAGDWEVTTLSTYIFESTVDFLPALRQRAFAGLIADVDHERQLLLSRLGRPVVNLNVNPPLDLLPSVVIDEIEVGATGARHLLESGASSFAFCGLDTGWSRGRERGFGDAVAAAGFEYETLSKFADSYRGTGTEVVRTELVRRWLAHLKKPVAIMACSDDIASQIIEEATFLRLQLPDEIAVLGVDNTPEICEFLPVSLSSVDLNPMGRGYAAAALLDRLMRGEPAPVDSILVPPRRVMPRRSTEIVASGQPRLRAAVTYIREHACDGIDVSDVAKSVNLSRVKLHRVFQERLGRSPGEEIRRVRFRHVEKLLLGSRMPLTQIATRSGFSSSAYMSAAFKRAYGVSPGDFRRKHNAAEAEE